MRTESDQQGKKERSTANGNEYFLLDLQSSISFLLQPHIIEEEKETKKNLSTTTGFIRGVHDRKGDFQTKIKESTLHTHGPGSEC